MSLDPLLTAAAGFFSAVRAWLAPLINAISIDHLEGGAVVAAILLGPSLIAGIAHGFVDALKIEWRHHREKPLVIDGDTISIRGQRIRIYGIDAPELGQPWWDEAGKEHDSGRLVRDMLARLVMGRRLEVQILHEDQYQRAVALVKVDGKDIGRHLVAEGLAFASPGSSRYQRTEAGAKRRRKGFWRGQLERPWNWRKIA